MQAFMVIQLLLALWYCSIAAGNVGPAEEGCECLDYDNVQDSHCDANVFPGWAQEYAIMAAGTMAELICYAQHPCLSQDVIIVWHISTEGEAEEDVGRGSYHNNDDLGQLHLQRGLNISTHCFNFYCHSMLLIPVVAVNNHTRVWCGAYTKVCPGNEQNPAPPITVVVQGSLPGPPHNVTVLELNSTHLQLSWLPPPPTHMPPLTHYSVHVNNFTGDVMDYVTTNSILTVPRPAGSVEFYIGACNAAGEGEASSIAYKRETLQDIILGEAAGALCFHCEFTADSQAQGCQVEVWNKRNGAVEQSFSLSHRSLLMTCARGLRMESTEYVVIAREIEVSGKIGTEVIRHWDPLLLPPSPPSLSTTEPTLTKESSSESLSLSDAPLPSEDVEDVLLSEDLAFSEEPSPLGEPSLRDEKGETPKNIFVEFFSSWFGFYTTPTSVVPLPATETLRDKNGEATEEAPSRDEGEAASHSPVPSPTTEEQSLRDDVGKDEQALGNKNGDEEEERPLENKDAEEERATGDEDRDKIAAPSIPHQSLEEAVVNDEAEEEVEGTEEPAFRTEDGGGMEDSLPVVFLTSEDSMVGERDKDEGLTEKPREDDVRKDTLPTTSPISEDRDGPTLEEPMVEEKEKDKEDLTEILTSKKYDVGEENALPTVSQTLEDRLVKDGDQQEEEFAHAETQVKVEHALPSGSLTTEVPVVIGEDKGVGEGEELKVTDRDRDEEQSTVFRKDKVRKEDAPPIITLKSEKPMVGVEEKDKDQDTEKPKSRKDEEGVQPIVSLTSEEPVVGDGGQEQVDESTETVVGEESDVREDTLPTTSPTSEDQDGPTLEEPMVIEDDKDLTEKPTFRKDGVGEENALPTAYPTLDDPVVKDGDQEEEEYTEKQVKVEYVLPSGSLTTEEPVVICEDKGVGEGAELKVTDRDRDEEQSTVFGKDKVRKEDVLPIITLKSEEPMVGVEEKDKDQDTEKPKSRKDKEGAQPIVSLTSEEPMVGDGDQEQVDESTETVVGKESDVREDTLPTTSPTSEDRPTLEEPMVEEKDKDDEDFTEKPTSRKNDVGEENALPTVSPTLEDPMVKDGDQKEEEYTEKQVKVGYVLPSVSPMTEEPVVVGEDKGVEEGEELKVTDRDRDEEQSTVFGKDKVMEEDVLPNITLKSEEPMVGVEEKNKDQEPTSRKDEEGTQPIVSLTSEEPVVGDGDQEQVKESTETVVGKEDEVGVEYALPTVSQSSEEPVIGDVGKDGEKGTEDKDEVDEDEEKDAEKLIVRGNSFQPILPPSPLMARGEDKDKKEDPDVKKPIPMVRDEDGEHEGTLPSASEEPMVESTAEVKEEDKGVLLIPSQEPVATERDGELRGSMLPILSPSLGEHKVRDEGNGEDHEESVAALPIHPPTSEEPIVRNNGYEEEDELPIVTPSLEEPIVEDGEEEEGNVFLPIPPQGEDQAIKERDKGTPPANTYAGLYDICIRERPTALLLIVGVVLLGVLITMVLVAVTRRRITGTHSPQQPSTGSLYPHEPNPQGIPTHHLPAQEQVHTPESSEQLEELIPFPQPTYYRDFRKKFRYKLGN